MSTQKQNRFMDEVRAVFRLKHYSIHTLEEKINAVRAPKKVNVPVVMTREEVRQVISLMQGTPQLVVKLLYGCRLRVKEALRLRIFDVDFKRITSHTFRHYVESGIMGSVA